MNIKEIDALLPQTQCEECGFKGCKPYATALVNDDAEIDLCPPGGLNTLHQLANALNIDPAPYEENVINNTRSPSYARIREADCIGCTKCIQACPVDAIIGTNKQMHTVIEKECTGCQLCVEPCPVDCIDMIEIDTPLFEPLVSRQRFENRNTRLMNEKQKKRTHYQQTKTLDSNNDVKAKQDYIQALMKRKKQPLS